MLVPAIARHCETVPRSLTSPPNLYASCSLRSGRPRPARPPTEPAPSAGGGTLGRRDPALLVPLAAAGANFLLLRDRGVLQARRLSFGLFFFTMEYNVHMDFSIDVLDLVRICERAAKVILEVYGSEARGARESGGLSGGGVAAPPRQGARWWPRAG